MYDNKETNRSYEYLQKVVSVLEEPICLLGGWAVFLTVNKNYKANTGRDYLGSRDIDLGFHLEEKKKFFKSSFVKAMKKLEEEGFNEVGGRMVKELDFDTGKELLKEEAQAKPIFDIHKMFVDLMVDYIPKSFDEKNSKLLLDETLLEYVFSKKENRSELEEFNKKLWLPKPWLLLAMKTKSLPGRQKEDKRKKDIADIAAILLFARGEIAPPKMFEVLRKDKILQSLKEITQTEIKETESLLGVLPNSFSAALSETIRQVEQTFKGKVKKIISGGKAVQVARNHSVAQIKNEIPNLKIGDLVICTDFETIRKI
ncbi:MAG: hypothetical protein Q7S21_05775 [archaeon]|nr:hypothetical protein [archaeon]